MASKPNGNGNGKRKGTRQPVQFVIHPDTEQPVQGLRIHKPTGRYYRLENGKRVYYPKDGMKGDKYLRRSIYLHDCWQRGVDPIEDYKTLNVPLPVPHAELIEPEETRNIFDGSYKLRYDIPQQAYLDAIKEDIAQDPEGMATKLGLPRTIFLNVSFAETMTLTEVGTWYLEKRKKKVTAQTASDNKRYWRQFVNLIGDKRLAEIATDEFNNYYETIYHQFETEGKSPAWIRNRFGLVGSILRYAIGKGNSTDDAELQRLLALCDNWELPDKHKNKPVPIEVDDFHKLLEACKDDPKFTACLHVALNAAYYPIDCSQLLLVDIDLDNKVIINMRTKKRTERVCCLTDRTLAAIRSYMDSEQFKTDHPNETETLFNWTKARVTHWFRKYREIAKLSETVTFNQIRDFAYTWAATESTHGDNVNLDSARILAGHRIDGEVDAYFKRHEDHVRACTRRIDEAMFSPKREEMTPATKTKGKTTQGGKK